MEATNGKPEDLLGAIMDNAPANRSAMRLLEVKMPTWIAIGCIAHALNLLFKDWANEAKCK